MRPHRAGRHHLRPAYGCDLARRATPGGGLLRGDGLAPSTGLDRSRRLAPPARCDPHRAADGQAAGDGRLCHRRIAHPRPQRRSSHRTISSRPGPPRQQAPRHRRPARHTARCVTDRRQPTRCHPAHAARRCHPPHSWTARTAAPSPAMPVRRPRLRLRQVPATPPAPRDSSENRPPWCPHGSGLGKTRWVVERTFAWLHQFKRLRIRYEIRADFHLALLQLACSIICLRRLRTSF